MILPNIALNQVLNSIDILGAENLPVISSLGRIIAQTCVSKRDIPFKDSSAMDGYAVKFDDVKNTPVELKVLGVIAAGGDVSQLHINHGESYRIMTGAHIPSGADTVIQREHTNDGVEKVLINESKAKGDHIRPAKDDIARGDILDYIGEQLSPFHLSRLISIGALNVDFYRKPRVAVISTGSEIAAPGEYDKADKLIDANAPAVMAMIEAEGGVYSYLGVIPDKEEYLLNTLESLKGFDMVVVSGGISAGDFDCMAHISDKAGIEWFFTKVSQKPGKPFSFGMMRGMPIFGLPGNPVSCMFCAYYYLIPAIRKMGGVPNPAHTPLIALLAEDVSRSKGRVHFDRVRLELHQGTLTAHPFRSQNSNLIASMVDSHAFMELDGDIDGTIKKGTPVNIYIFNSKGIF